MNLSTSEGKRSLVLLILLVVILAGLAWFSIYRLRKPTAGPTATPTPTFVQAVISNKAPKGQLVTGFPAGLVVDPNATILGSAENNSSDPTKKLLVTSYKTKLSLAALKQKYSDYFGKEKWTVAYNSDASGKLYIMALFSSISSVIVNTVDKDSSGNNVVMVVLSTNK